MASSSLSSPPPLSPSRQLSLRTPKSLKLRTNLHRPFSVKALSVPALSQDDLKKARYLVTGLGGSRLAMPVEVVQFCRKYNLVRLQELFKEEGVDANLRLDRNGNPNVTDNSNYIVDLYFKTPIRDGMAAGAEISALEGVVEHGLFLNMATSVIIAGKTGVDVKDK